MTVGVLSVKCTECSYNSGVTALPRGAFSVYGHEQNENNLPCTRNLQHHDFTIFHFFFNCLSHFTF